MWLAILLLLMQGGCASTLASRRGHHGTESGVTLGLLQTVHILHRTVDPTGHAAPLEERRLIIARFDGPSDLDWYHWSTKREAEQRIRLQVSQGARDVTLLFYKNKLQVS
ncbi:hypothetical protein SAMN04488112_1236 [Melghirimyces thermohalophilus]|uniref:Uncharacterized protein n=1 Tax=Melghirimyces thermohalophilus TaxID=1236220 RepID=A0A1G6QP28_9BACL|nr:hypothetical protein [Melghirimyces thermohalophilus]SDC94073.1 hypothetical protein SAMN04488112_1236 [Melghirimyces thermohalophilus]